MVAERPAIALEVPTIDMTWPEDRAVEVMKAACLRTGFFYVTNHGLEELEAKHFEESRKFFALPEEVKREIMMDENLRGFTPMANETLDPGNQREGDTKEGIYIGQEIPADSEDAKLPLHGPNQWPREELAPNFRPVMTAYYDAMMALGMRLMRMLALTLDLPRDWFVERFEKPLGSLRPIHYSGRVSQPDDGIYGCGAHSDYGVLTLLAQDDTGGLQILTKDQKWMDVPPQAGTMVVNLGDMLERWTNLRYKSTKHRVITRTPRERYSCAFFLEPGFNTVVDAQDVLPYCAPGKKPIFPPITSGDYLMMKFKNTHEGFEPAYGHEIPVQ